MKVINLDKEIFEQACNLCEKSFSEDEIWHVLDNGSDVEKQIAILKIDNIEEKVKSNVLVSHLTGQDGPIREAVAIKLNELVVQKKCNWVDFEEFYRVYVDALCDVNPNVSRSVIDFLPELKNQTVLLRLIFNKVEQIFSRIENPDIEQKNFLTVRLFNLYWCLDAIGALLEKQMVFDDVDRLCFFLEKATYFNNYTIDEKIARILATPLFKNKKNFIIDKIQNVNNFYVKRYLNK